MGTKNVVIFEFTSYLKKCEVLGKSNNLKDTGISISHDLGPKDQTRSKILYQHMKAARNLNLKAYIKNFKLYINNEVYTVDNLPNFEETTNTYPTEDQTSRNTAKKLVQPSKGNSQKQTEKEQ